jgi:[acyl-carrier-protein] S-malonyltransferase
MGREWRDACPESRAVFDEADEALGAPLSRLCFEGPAEELILTENTQPAILTVSVAIFRRLAAEGFRPSFVAGHSLGEYSANVAAGSIRFGDAVRIVRRRGRYMQEAVPQGEGAMAAVLGLELSLVEQACREAAEGEVVAPANMNAPGQIVIAGNTAAVDRAAARAKALGARRTLPLPVSAPFHCELMAPAARRLRPELRALEARDPAPPVVANVDAEVKRTSAETIDALERQATAPVLWESVVRRLASEGVRTYVEVGPGSVLSGLVRRIDPGATVLNVDAPAHLAAAAALAAR